MPVFEMLQDTLKKKEWKMARNDQHKNVSDEDIKNTKYTVM